jgi:hypothetical protein
MLHKFAYLLATYLHIHKGNMPYYAFSVLWGLTLAKVTNLQLPTDEVRILSQVKWYFWWPEWRFGVLSPIYFCFHCKFSFLKLLHFWELSHQGRFVISVLIALFYAQYAQYIHHSSHCKRANIAMALGIILLIAKTARFIKCCSRLVGQSVL